MTTLQEVSQHSTESSCWVVIHGVTYDVTDFLPHHPGGKRVILKQAGGDATTAFDAVHPRNLLEKYLRPTQVVGKIADYEQPRLGDTQVETSEQQKLSRNRLARIISIPDFESAAADVLDPKYFAFFKAGANSEITASWNQKSWDAVRFRPRVLVPISHVDTSTTMLGSKFSAPFFIAPAGGGKFAHPNGETIWTRAAAKHGILQWVCNSAGCSQMEMADARSPGQILFWQIYALKDLEVTKREIQQAVALGYKGLALTVDAIRIGKRERDIRMHLPSDDDNPGIITDSDSISATRPMLHDQFDFASVIAWLRSMTNLPVAIKGVQSWEDAELCMKHGLHPWLSNHGGRQLDGAPAAIETLVEIRKHCPEVFVRCEVFVDGGVTRGTDIVKALALGAKGVAVGRGFLYALTFGVAGVSKAIEILMDEVRTAMALLGVSSITQLQPCHVDTSGLAYAGAVVRARL